MTSLYNNFYNNRRFNRLNNKSNNRLKPNHMLILVAVLLVTCFVIYKLLKTLDVHLSFLNLYNWILGIEKKIVVQEEIEETLENEDGKQVYNISQNNFTYDDAKLLCNSFNSELATLEQVINAYKHGANWCNMGWTQDQLALYPIQKSYWESIQNNQTTADSCGFPGVNGGYYKNPNLRFGVNCYGVKPKPKNNERINLNYVNKYSDNEKKIFKFKQNMDKYKVLPFNSDKWSEYQ